eukprot:m.44842 g.44842  ORF g.44842 m.44842 type:complete len:1433 (+) comp12138_c0_seq1:241-4539(+)
MEPTEHAETTHASPADGGQYSDSSTDFCHVYPHGQDAILFVFFALGLGVLMKRLIDSFKIPVPYTVCLLLLGLGWGGLVTIDIGYLGNAACLLSDVDPQLLLVIFLPMLVFESAFSLDWHAFKNVVFPALILAVPGLIFSLFLTGIIVHYVVLPSFDWNSSFLLGTLLSATDPVAVVALLKELGGPPALATLIESESLLNDGTAIVAFEIFQELAKGIHLTGGEGVEMAFQLSFGGPALGLLWGIVTIFLIGRIIDDDLAEVTVTLLSAYLLFYVAEDVCHVSGVLALVTLGACFAAYGKTRISPRSELATHTFWRILTYHGNTLIFVFVGIVLVLSNDFTRIEGRDWGMVIVLWALLYLIRGLMLLVFAYPLKWAGYPLTWKDSVIIVHGGLRGAVSLALALIISLAESAEENEEGEGYQKAVIDKTLFYAGGVAFLTLIINASTTGPILSALGLVKEAAAQKRVYDSARETVREMIHHRAKIMSKDKLFSTANWDQACEFVMTRDDKSAVDFHEQLPRTPRPSPRPSLHGEIVTDEDMFDLPQSVSGMPGNNVNEQQASTPRVTVASNESEGDFEPHDEVMHHGDEDDDDHAITQHVRTDSKLVHFFASARRHLPRFRGHLHNHQHHQHHQHDQHHGAAAYDPQSMATGSLRRNASEEMRRTSSALYASEEGHVGKSSSKPAADNASSFDFSCRETCDQPSNLKHTHSAAHWFEKLKPQHHAYPMHRPSTSRTADLQNARLRFLDSTRAIYWELFESGFLDPQSTVLLVNASEREKELIEADANRVLQDWNDELKKFVSTPLMIRILRSASWGPFDALRLRALRWYEIHHGSLCVNIADAFTAAHRKVLGDLSGLLSEVVTNPEHGKKLVQESFANVEQAKKLIRSFPHEVVSIVRTRQAAALLLTFQEDAITTKFHHGVFTALERDNLMAHVRRVRSHLVLQTPRFTFPSPSEVLKWSRLLEDLTPEELETCLDHMEDRVFSAGEDIVEANNECEGMFIILRGYAYFYRPSDKQDHTRHTSTSTNTAQYIDYLMAGQTMGVIETVAQQPGLLSIRVASAKLQAGFFSQKAVQFLIDTIPSFKRNIFRLCAFQLSYVRRRRLFAVAGRVLPHARNIAQAPFSVQEDLWPFAVAGSMEDMIPGQRLALSVAGVVVSGRYRKIKETSENRLKRGLSSAIRLSSFLQGEEPTSRRNSGVTAPMFNAGVHLGDELSGPRTGLPPVMVAKDSKAASTFNTPVLKIPQVQDECREVAAMSDTYSTMLATEHFQRQQMKPVQRNHELEFEPEDYVSFRVLPPGEYLCEEAGLIFAMGPTALRTPDIFERGASTEALHALVEERHAGNNNEEDGSITSARSSVSSNLHRPDVLIEEDETGASITIQVSDTKPNVDTVRIDSSPDQDEHQEHEDQGSDDEDAGLVLRTQPSKTIEFFVV